MQINTIVYSTVDRFIVSPSLPHISVLNKEDPALKDYAVLEWFPKVTDYIANMHLLVGPGLRALGTHKVVLAPNRDNGPLLLSLHRLGQAFPGRGDRDGGPAFRSRSCPWIHAYIHSGSKGSSYVGNL